MLRPAAIALFAAALLFAQKTPAQKRPVTIDAVVNAPPSNPGAITWAPDGEHFVFTDRGELSLYDVHSGKERSIIALEKLQNAAVLSPPSPVFDWTNRRVGERSEEHTSELQSLR